MNARALFLASISEYLFASHRAPRQFRLMGAAPEQSKEIIDRLSHFKRQGSRAWRWKGARR